MSAGDSALGKAWAVLLERSPRLARPALAPLPAPPGFGPASAWEAARRYLEDPTGPPSGQLRLYEDGTQVVPSAETLDRVRRQVEGGPAQALAFLNHAERWLGRDLAPALAWCDPLLETFPPESFERELHLIAGRYASTPFGIHVDSPLERVVHLNLGPGTKVFYLWAEDRFIAETGSRQANHELELHLPWATVFEVPPGRAFVLPEGWYHLAASPRPSTVLALTVHRREEVSIPGARSEADGPPATRRFDDPLPPSLVSGGAKWYTSVDNSLLQLWEGWRQRISTARGFDALAEGPSDLPSNLRRSGMRQKGEAMTDETKDTRLDIEDLELEADPGNLLGPRRDTGPREMGRGAFRLIMGGVQLDVPADFGPESLRRLLDVLEARGVKPLVPGQENLGPRRDIGPREELLGPPRDIKGGTDALGPRRDIGPREDLLGPPGDIKGGTDALGPRRDIGPRE